MRRDAGNYGEPRAVEHDPGQPEMTTVASNHGDNGDAASASEADNLGVDTGHERRRGKIEKGHWLTTNSTARSARSERARRRRNRRRRAVGVAVVVLQ